MVAEEYNDPAGVYKVQTFGTLQKPVRSSFLRTSFCQDQSHAIRLSGSF
jgi:hypothetical protein